MTIEHDMQTGGLIQGLYGLQCRAKVNANTGAPQKIEFAIGSFPGFYMS